MHLYGEIYFVCIFVDTQFWKLSQNIVTKLFSGTFTRHLEYTFHTIESTLPIAKAISDQH